MNKSESESESLSQDMKQESEEKAEKAYRMKKDSKDKEEEQDSEKKKKKKKVNQHPVSESSLSVTFHSPPTPPYTRTSPTLHSLHDSPISNDNFHSSAPVHLHSSVSDGILPVSDGILPVVVANQFPMEEKTVTVVGRGDEVEEGPGGGSGVSDFLKNKKEAKLNMALLWLRITAFVFCMISFSVLASDRKQGPGQISFYWFREYKYSLSVNVIGFGYSGLQICDLVKYLITKKHTVDPKLRGYFNFAMDQILTYILMSASSSAATVAANMEIDWGVDKFTEIANASVVLSYFAFVAFALTSLVSGYILCRV